MTTPRYEVTRVLDELRQERDLLRIRLHLAGTEAHDQWDKLEKRWNHLGTLATLLGCEAANTASHVVGAIHDVAHELHRGYARMRTIV
jgi:hypothetical protein